jgi:hypothetical protein
MTSADYKKFDILEYCQIEELFGIEGMCQMSGKEVAHVFNQNMNMQIAYIEDSNWEVIEEDSFAKIEQLTDELLDDKILPDFSICEV